MKTYTLQLGNTPTLIEGIELYDKNKIDIGYHKPRKTDKPGDTLHKKYLKIVSLPKGVEINKIMNCSLLQTQTKLSNSLPLCYIDSSEEVVEDKTVLILLKPEKGEHARIKEVFKYFNEGTVLEGLIYDEAEENKIPNKEKPKGSYPAVILLKDGISFNITWLVKVEKDIYWYELVVKNNHGAITTEIIGKHSLRKVPPKKVKKVKPTPEEKEKRLTKKLNKLASKFKK